MFVLESDQFPFLVVALFADDVLRRVVEDYFVSPKREPLILNFLEVLSRRERFYGGQVFLLELLRNLVELFKQNDRLLGCFDSRLVVGVRCHRRFLKFLLLSLYVLSEPVTVPGVLVAGWCLSVDVSSDVDVLQTK
jgi:hypothetical protein